ARRTVAAQAMERDSLRSQLEEMFGKLAAAEKSRADYAALQAKYADAAKAADQHGAVVAELTGLNEKLTSDKAALDKQVAQLKQASDLAVAELTELRNRLGSSDRAAQEHIASI